MNYQNIKSVPRFLKLEVVAEQVSMGKSTILAWEALDKFPRAVRLSPTKRVWLQEDIERWINEKHTKAKEGNRLDKTIPPKGVKTTGEDENV